MPKSNAGWVTSALAVYTKDLRQELRSRYGMSTILMFGITTLTVVSFSFGQSGLPSKVMAALYWIVMFFSAMSGLAQVFVREEESGTAMALRLSAEPEAVFAGKYGFNLSLLAIMTAVITPIFLIFNDVPPGWGGLQFGLMVSLGIVGLCGGTTLVAAIISRAAVRGALFAVLAFPILIPLLFVLISGTDKALSALPLGEMLAELQFLFAYAVVMTTGSVMLFRFVWSD
ncbi:MAG: heme exporter protein CcmB [bacterium]